MKKQIRYSILTYIMLSLLLLSACKDDDDDVTPDETSSSINLSSNGTLGSILVDGDGKTLYFFTKDTDGTSKCAGGCLDFWPIYYVENPEIGNGLDAVDFGEITRDDGEKQTTYKGWPLYYYSSTGDGATESAGATNGEAVNNVWFVAKPDYSIMLANAQLVGADGVNYTSDYTEGDSETQYFVDAAGRTLYIFINDSKDKNNFTAEDFSNDGVWPIFYDDIASLPSTLNVSDFGTIDVYGEQQLTYKGWPLYYFGQDTERGDNKGISFPAPGVWPIVNTDTEQAEEAPTVKITDDDTFGEIITDAVGNSLYYFTKDADGSSNCTGGCLNVWPIFYNEDIIIESGSNLDEDDFGTITLADGVTMQTTYKGWPLYYYSPTADGEIEDTGEVLGDGVNNVWYVAKESYSLMIADAQLVGHDGKNYTGDYEEGEGVTKYFTDAAGNTIYIFINDTKDTNNFTAEDFSNNGVWPIFYTEINELPSGMDKSDFGEILVYGEKQLTFRGWPLYYFGQDENRGENKGISFPSPGVWPIVNNNLNLAE
ncbi:COG4315 family predicted lipoprotein [Chondrinema litorale]|uniref:COG4315 family predicted lipoprotein n=1 Tax=Chondrinema litorale TaxID=2994555 RepID=UPI0032B5825D